MDGFMGENGILRDSVEGWKSLEGIENVNK